MDLPRFTIEAGESLWRHHNPAYPATELRSAHPHPTGRFDCPDPNGWASSYYGLSTQGAFGETLLRDVAAGTPIMIAAARLDGTAVSRVVASRDLELLDLRGPGMWPALDNEVQLLGYPVDNTIYPRARDAAARLHDDQPGTDGLAWLSVRNPQATSVLLWSDSTDAPLAAAEATVLTDDHHAAVAALLLDWHAVLMHQDTRIEPDPVAAGVLGWNR